ncbi:PREDICTED: NADH dehydrogenase [ubiquinone] 1 alpha subcomplex subunit 2 [Ipomoea nil]|uniref:NADH dehydrogenase [ubiquinone] 1 alpha subcomplex subunit 2 n=1 Tax=Ipomoea nil TaxID=35883 RepID=UPI0009014944|nr:PREDICTED: NADH dehydrogenase [ubiquinone] 1 alpha subcomplex subunit 2 [Ipomoea nil]
MAWTGQLSRNLKEIRILFSPNSPSSAPLRAFIENNYKQIKTHNPKLPILIREASSIEPQIWARFDMGVERGFQLEGFSEQQISKALEDLVKAGAS